MLEWSHGILTSREAEVFARLGVFVGSFSLEAATAVVQDPGDSDLDRWGAIDAIGALVDRSLVSVEEGEVPRYRLLQITREFALERLAERGEEDSTRQRHAMAIHEQLREIVTAAWEDRRRIDDTELLLEPELDNARAAFAWFLSRKDALAAVDMAPYLQFALTTDRRLEQSNVWESTRPFVTSDLPPLVRARWASRYSSHLIRLLPKESMSWARTALELHTELGNDAGRFEALCMLAMASARASEIDACEQACSDLARFDVTRFPVQLQLRALSARFALKSQLGETAELQSLIHRQMALLERVGDERSLLIMLSNLVAAALASDQIGEAVDRGKVLVQQLGRRRHPLALSYARVNLIGALVYDGQADAAAEMARVAWPAAVMFDIDAVLTDHLALLAALGHRPVAAARLLGYADARYAEMKTARLIFIQRRVDQAVLLGKAELKDDAQFERLRRDSTHLTVDDVLLLAFHATPS